jgi:DUF971 family protein
VLWDKLDKLQSGERAPRATAVDLSPDRDLIVTWDDGKQSRVPFRRLRQECPCAACIDEWTGERILDPASVPEDVKPVGFDTVGNYALRIRWSDGHETGLYSWRQLRGYVV